MVGHLGIHVSSLFKKLNLGSHQDILLLNAPTSLDAELALLEGVRVHRDPNQLARSDLSLGFALAFAVTQSELDTLSAILIDKAKGDAVLWIAYPKKSSKRYLCEFDRDRGWGVLGAAGYEGVRMVAIDQDWSALRLRKVEYIKTLRRDPARALSIAGKRRSGGG